MNRFRLVQRPGGPGRRGPRHLRRTLRRNDNMECALVFPHQLYWPHPAIRPGRVVLLVEDPLFFGPDIRWPARMHRQKLILHRASMRSYADRLRSAGFAVNVLNCPRSGGHTIPLLRSGLPRAVTRLHYADPVDDVLSRRLRKFADEQNLPCTQHETPGFLTPETFLEECFGQGRKPFMARFYEQQRRRMKILVTETGEPTGGQWSFDSENRKRLARGTKVPPLPRARDDVPVAAEIAKEFPQARGREAPFLYPATHAAAEHWLDEFLSQRLAGFGTFEDAISVRHPVLFHSALTPALNVGLLTPELVVRRTLAHAAENPVPLNALEGFLRQIIGWREFLRAMYERHGRTMRQQNFWGFQRRMPRAFSEGTTGIAPVDHVIRNVQATGYCHHIERLMILGNFFLLCRIHPDDVYLWFMEMFVDSYDWVMVPNVYGMSQFADGGGFTTKPYLSGSNYVLKMSDHPRGPWCEVWDALFWTFIADYREVFVRNPRLTMMARLCDKLGNRLTAHRRVAERFLANLS